MVGTSLGVSKSWLKRWDNKLNGGQLPWRLRVVLKDKISAKLQDVAKAMNEVARGDEKGDPYYVEDGVLKASRYEDWKDKGVPKGTKVNIDALKEWIVRVKHPDINFEESKQKERELDRIAYRIFKKIESEGVKPSYIRANRLEAFKIQYNKLKEVGDLREGVYDY